MGFVMGKAKGQVDGTLVQQKVRARLEDPASGARADGDGDRGALCRLRGRGRRLREDHARTWTGP